MTPAFSFIVFAIAAIMSAGCDKAAPRVNRVDCPDLVTGCRFELDGQIVALQFSESPRAMKPFVIEVGAPKAVSVEADFAMPGMEMVPNRYHLGRKHDGYWHATVVLPVCISGREDWVLVLSIGDQRASVPFSAGK